MKKRHNKKRNTAFIYEALIREMSKAVINRDDSLRSNILSLVKENFNKSSVLGKELSCYKLLDENLGVDKYTAEKIIFRTKKEYDSLDKDHIFEAQSKVIKSINQDIGQSVFSNFIPNYKSFATIAQIFNDKTPLKQRILMEEKIIENLMGARDESKNKKDSRVDRHVLSKFVEKFNQKYRDLLPEQRNLLSKYVMSFSNSGVDFKVFLGDELKRLYEQVKKSLDLNEIKEDQEMRDGTNKVLERIQKYDISNFSDRDMKSVLKIQKLVSEYQTDDN